MKCIICNSESKFFFRKYFEGVFKEMIDSSEYYRCNNCGFTFSPTIFSLNSNDFAQLNKVFHTYIEDQTVSKKANQPPYLEQATMLRVLEKNGLIDLSDALDFAGGYGTLNKIMESYFNGARLLIYDPYMQDCNSRLYVEKKDLKKYATVFNSAFFEHITSRKTLDEINSRVSDNGVLLIHSVICENIPNDENWFYLNPVHCAFHTNKSMTILMKQWGYKWSAYAPSAKTWMLFKNELQNEGVLIDKINNEFQTKYLHYTNIGFLDFWKGF